MDLSIIFWKIFFVPVRVGVSIMPTTCQTSGDVMDNCDRNCLPATTPVIPYPKYCLLTVCERGGGKI
ncbi:hypothetical protein EB796_020851 [Bugula neritina]|uniref:Uncharacterized protein n=1 Tax=Bugula neritina TaxID=10212 RepID=A0A7J7J422_BUGNE|nr:hypothetical protein EB796_020851 [Bugula neritina]